MLTLRGAHFFGQTTKVHVLLTLKAVHSLLMWLKMLKWPLKTTPLGTGLPALPVEAGKKVEYF